MTAGGMLRRKAVSSRVRPTDEKQQAETAYLQSELKYYETQAARRSTVVSLERSRGDRMDRTGGNGSGGEHDSLKEPKTKTDKTN